MKVGCLRNLAAAGSLIAPLAGHGVGLTPDASFNGVGIVHLNTQGATPIWHFSRPTSGGKIVLVGSVCPTSGGCASSRKLVVARLLADGTLDTTFAPASGSSGSMVYTIGAASFSAAGAAVDASDRIVITGRTHPADETAVIGC